MITIIICLTVHSIDSKVLANLCLKSLPIYLYIGLFSNVLMYIIIEYGFSVSIPYILLFYISSHYNNKNTLYYNIKVSCSFTVKNLNMCSLYYSNFITSSCETINAYTFHLWRKLWPVVGYKYKTL